MSAFPVDGNEADPNPDFIDCAGCGGDFYRGDLIDDLCSDCLFQEDDA